MLTQLSENELAAANSLHIILPCPLFVKHFLIKMERASNKTIFVFYD